VSAMPADLLDPDLSPRRKLRIVAVVELAKAAAVVVAGIGLLNADAGAIVHAARSLLQAVGLDPLGVAGRALLDLAHDADRHPAVLVAALGVYAAARVAEGTGLWLGQNWARWFGLVSAGLFIPFELAYLAYDPGLAGAVLLAINLGVMWLLWPPRRTPSTPSRK
jgi:uncharacterized membrane protein (DUF2068 family)